MSRELLSDECNEELLSDECNEELLSDECNEELLSDERREELEKRHKELNIKYNYNTSNSTIENDYKDMFKYRYHISKYDYDEQYEKLVKNIVSFIIEKKTNKMIIDF